MDKAERHALAERITWLKHWSDLAQWIVATRQSIVAQGQVARAGLEGRSFACTVEGRHQQVLPLDPVSDAPLMEQLIAARSLPALSPADHTALSIGSDEVTAILGRAEGLVRARRIFMSSGQRRERDIDAQTVLSMYERALAEELGVHLETLTPDGLGASPSVMDVARELAGSEARVVSGDRVRDACSGRDALQRVGDAKDAAERQIQELGTSIRIRDVGRSLSEMSVHALKASTSGRLRLGAIERAGLTTVQDVLEFGPLLSTIDGVGEQTARQTWAAAETMRSMIQRETPLRIDVKRRHPETSRVLSLLWTWAQTAEILTRAEQAADVVTGLAPLLDHRPVNGSRPSHLVVASSGVAEQLSDALVMIGRWSAEAAALDRPPEDPWSDFLARPADYLGWMSLLGFLTEDAASAEGQLSEALIARVRAQDLDTSLLHDVSLRGYQDFAARFALVQRKVILGDEMGLGKTIEALAMLAHIHAKGGTHSIVVCPASVVSNWMREMLGRSNLGAYRLHGQDRLRRAHEWARRGGVAITTFETLKALHDVLDGVDVHAVVVDEAHYIKNPGAKRTRNSRALVDRADHALFLTGTPIENRLEEFENLVSYLQPKLLEGLGAYTANSFPRLIAPAYLRRNQEDVLTELPDRIDVAEWLPMSEQDESAYVEAVADGNFMAMRRAALLTGEYSEKMIRLDEIVTEARTNHRKVIVFSYFRDVLEAVAERLDGMVVGPLTGSVPAPQRQALVDEFTKAQPGAVLVSQISAGGVGLNIQAGSVVVICEPQVKPSMESQAVARAHRMGQTETVQVHRLLSEEGVDRRMVEILAEKQRLFDEFARVSHTADSAPEAFDITEAELAREVIATERERLARRIRTIDSRPPTTEEIA